MASLQSLRDEIAACSLCSRVLPHEPRPVVVIDGRSKIVVIGQAPGRLVHQSGVPWRDRSGSTLREWLGVDEETFYEPGNFALVPMGFCYPGRGVEGDLPPRPECALQWHERVLQVMGEVRLMLLVGRHAQAHYLPGAKGRSLGDTVRQFKSHLPRFLPLPHPSPRNQIWMKRNPWFHKELIPELRRRVASILSPDGSPSSGVSGQSQMRVK